MMPSGASLSETLEDYRCVVDDDEALIAGWEAKPVAFALSSTCRRTERDGHESPSSAPVHSQDPV
jgi:hypothetical protein